MFTNAIPFSAILNQIPSALPAAVDAANLALKLDWDELDAVGSRYTMGSRTGARLRELPHLLKYVLARRGITQADLDRLLPPGGLATLAQRTAPN